MKLIPNNLTIGQPGSGKTVGMARLALNFHRAVVSLDPHNDSLTALLLDHLDGEVLYHKLSDLDHPLGYGLLRSSANPDPGKRLQENRRRAKQFVEVMMRRRGGAIASAPADGRVGDGPAHGLPVPAAGEGPLRHPLRVPAGDRRVRGASEGLPTARPAAQV